jgi:signal transduction histidine kinase
MPHSWDDRYRWEARSRDWERGSRGRQRKRRRGRRELSPEEQALREARRRAGQKISFVRHLLAYSFVVVFLLFVTRSPFVAGIVGLSWGIGLSLHFFQALVAPELRRKWIQHEVERGVTREVHRSVSRQRRVLADEKTRSLEELSASIAHEIRNPITAAKSLVQQMGEDQTSEENVEYAEVALQELDRVERSISHLLRYAREEDMRVRSLRLSEVLESALEPLQERLAEAGVELIREFDAEGEMDGDTEQLRRVFINLIGNALDALRDAGTNKPRIDLAVGESLSGAEVWARVRDNGPGIDPQIQDKIFTPFFTSKQTGTGLGLAIVRKLVEAHGGSIDLNSGPGEGTEFVLVFPKQGENVGASK